MGLAYDHSLAFEPSVREVVHTPLTSGQRAILRRPHKHMDQPMAALGLMLLDLIEVRRRYWLFGDVDVFLTRKGKKLRAELPPECFRSDPGPQAAAENDCFSCGHKAACAWTI